MKIRLQNQDKFLEFGELDTITGSFQTYTKDAPVFIKGGSFSYCEDDLLAIFVKNNRIIAKIGDKEIPIRNGISASLETFEKHNVLRVFDGKKEALSYKYIPEKGIPGDMTPFVDREDNDFLLFMANVINTPERQEVFIEVHGEG